MQKRLITTILIGFLIILTALGIITHFSVQDSVRRSLAQQQELTRIIAGYYDQLLETNLVRLYDISLSGRVNLEDIDMTPETGALKTAYDYSLFSGGVFIARPDGAILHSFPDRIGLHTTLSDLPEFKTAVEKKVPVITNLITTDSDDRYVLALVPLKDSRGQFVGIAGGRVDIAAGALNKTIHGITENPAVVITLSDANDHIMAGQKNKQNGLPTSTDLSKAPWKVTISEPASSLLAPSENLEQKFLVLGVVAILAALALAIGISRSIVTPVRELIRATDRITKGDISSPVKIMSGDEMGVLSKSFDRMRSQLAESIKKIKASNQDLEERVTKRTRELEKNRERLAYSISKIITAQEEERERVARELHDETSQSIAALGLSMDVAVMSLESHTLTPTDITTIKTKLDHIADGINRLIQDLRPPILNDLGLVSAIRWVMERHLSDKGIHFRVSVAPNFEEWIQTAGIEAKAELAFFRIIQEAIINIAKHAKARHVVVSITFDAVLIAVRISDDGIGFDVAEVFKKSQRGRTRGFGIIGLRERVALLNGKFHVESRPNEGATIKIEIPALSLEGVS